MLRKMITYTDYNNKSRTEAFYFNLSKAELVEMEMTTEGGMEAFLQSIAETKDNRELFKLFKTMIEKSYGIKSPDGKRFMKSPEISASFMQTEAYTALLLELMGDDSANKVAEFVRGIMPLEGVSDEEINKIMKDATAQMTEVYPETT